jgi:Acetyltransferase (GNAT) family
VKRLILMNRPIHLEHITTPHWLLRGSVKVPKQMQGQARRFWRHCLRADHGVCAWSGASLVGFVRYDDRPGRAGWALGTWVHPRWRRSGLALRLWHEVLVERHWNSFHIGTVSRAGRRLAQVLASRYGDISWELEAIC